MYNALLRVGGKAGERQKFSPSEAGAPHSGGERRGEVVRRRVRRSGEVRRRWSRCCPHLSGSAGRRVPTTASAEL